MERLLVLRLEALGCTAEALLNGVPVARVDSAQTLITLPVHEFTLFGNNALELVVHPAPPGAPVQSTPMLSDGQSGASLRLLLPRVNSVASPTSARTLAQLDWAPVADVVFDAPASVCKSVDLPIAFPRWRWLDAPMIADSPTLPRDLAAYLLPIAVGLAKGDAEPLIQASRLRLEELAAAYQRNLADDVARLRQNIQALHAAQALKPALPAPGKIRLRAVAGGRLMECLADDGSALLKSPVAGGGMALWPVRIAAVEGRFYVLR